MAAASGDNSELIDRAVAEHEALRAGGPHSLVEKHDKESGRIESCGSRNDPAHWTISYVWDEDDAVLPLAVGGHAHCHARFTAIAQSKQYWDRRLHPPPVVVVDGVRRHFRPAHGCHVVGVVEASGCTVLLVAVGESLAVVHMAGKARTIVYRGSPLGFTELDVDHMLRGARGARLHRVPRVRPPPAIRAQHLRIAGAVEVDVGEGPSIDTVLSYGLKALEWRAKTQRLAGRMCKRRGRTKLHRVIDAFLQVILTGGGTFEGGPGDVLREIRARCPDLDVDVETFSNILKLLHDAGSCLVQRPTPRTWRVCLGADLRDPRSDLHRRFCEETVGLVRAMVMGDGPAAANDRATGEPPSPTRPCGRHSAHRGAPAPATSAPNTGSAEPRAANDDPTTAASSSGPDASGAEPSANTNPTSASTPTTEPEAQGEPGADREGDIDLDMRHASLAATVGSFFECVKTIESWLEAEPDPLARAQREATLEGALLELAGTFSQARHRTIAEGLDTASPEERLESRVDEPQLDAAGPAADEPLESRVDEPLFTGPAADEPLESQADESQLAGPAADEPLESQADESRLGAVSEQVVIHLAEELLTEPPPLPAVEAEASQSPGPMPDEAWTGADEIGVRPPSDPRAWGATQLDARVCVDLPDGVTVGTVGEVVDDAPAAAADVDSPPVATSDSTAPLPHTVTEEHLGVTGGVDVHTAGEVTDDARRAMSDAALVELLHAADDENDGDILAHAEAPGAGSNTAPPASTSSQCDAGMDRARPRRPLFVPENCVILHTIGWTAPLFPAQVVPLARFARPAPILEPQSITDTTCTIAITSGTHEIAQDPRGPPPP